jgi:hypothetical protein
MFKRSPGASVPPAPETPKESPAAMVKRVEAELAAQRLRDAYAEERRIANAALAAERAEIVSVEAITVQTESAARRSERVEKVTNYSPLIVINLLAIVGQFGYFAENLTPTFGDVFGPIVAGLAAGALELISLFIGYHALLAMRRRDSAFGLLIASIGVAGLVAYMNYSHFSPELDRPTIAGLAFGLFSFIAPFLWRIKIRSDHRDELVANGEIDRRGLKLNRSRLIWHPIKSLKVIRHAAWTGETDPETAVHDWENTKAPRTIEDEIDRLEGEMIRAQIENARRDSESSDVSISARAPRAITSSNGYPTHHPKWNEAISKYAASVDSGTPLKVYELADEIGMTNRVLAGAAKRYVDNQMKGRNREHHYGSDLSSETA